MNKIAKLTAVSAAALIAGSSGAFAQAAGPKMSVGGFIDTKFTINDQSSDFQNVPGNKRINFDPRQDGEIWFNGSVDLDNGIKIRTRVELEAFDTSDGVNDLANFTNGPTHPSDGDIIDESWMNIGGSFGNIRIGSTDTASKRMSTGHQATFILNVGENTRFNIGSVISKPSAVSNSGVSQVDLQSDAESVSYVTPRFAGFVVGVDYTPINYEDSGQLHPKSQGSLTDIWGAAINWAGKFDQVSLSFNAAFQTAEPSAAGSNPEQYAVGGWVEFGAIKAGLSWQHNDSGGTSATNAEEDIIEAGIRYVQGANAFSVVAAWSTMDSQNAAVNDDESQVYSIAYRRTLGPGVNWHTTLHIANWEDGAPGSAASNSNEGYGITTGMLVRF